MVSCWPTLWVKCICLLCARYVYCGQHELYYNRYIKFALIGTVCQQRLDINRVLNWELTLDNVSKIFFSNRNILTILSCHKPSYNYIHLITFFFESQHLSVNNGRKFCYIIHMMTFHRYNLRIFLGMVYYYGRYVVDLLLIHHYLIIIYYTYKTNVYIH